MDINEERFWSHVEKRGDDDCWEWTGAKHINGYGGFHLNNPRKIIVGAHRVSWMIINGVIPDSLYVLHNCDNKLCVNPHHLRLGTHQDNMNDKILRRRCKDETGERNPRAKLTWEQVKEIRNRYIPGKITMEKLAKESGVSRASIGRIIIHETWKEKNTSQ